MNQLMAKTHTAINSMPIGRRISEIMSEKGKFYSISSMANRIGLSRETYRLMLKGERPIYTFELEKISADLRVPLLRITQEDIQNDIEELNLLFSELVDNNRALQISKSLLEVAIGETEKCDANTYVGRAYFALREYDLAHQYREQAYEIAIKIHDIYGETDRLHETLKFLMTSYTVMKDYSKAKLILDKRNVILNDNHYSCGALYYTLAMIAYDMGKLEETRNNLIQSLKHFEQTNNRIEIGRAEHCVAFIEYKLGNYKLSKEFFEKARGTLKHDIEASLTLNKDYAKLLLRLEKYQDARELIEYSLGKLQNVKLPALEEKFRFILAICNDDVQSLLNQISYSGNDMRYQLKSLKEYVKYLIEEKKYKKATEISRHCLPHLDSYPDLKSKFYLLLAISTNDVSFVEKLLSIPEVEKNIF